MVQYIGCELIGRIVRTAIPISVVISPQQPNQRKNQMPLTKGNSPAKISYNIRELHKGPQFKKTSEKFGPKKAQKQAVAIALSEARKTPMSRTPPPFKK